MKKNLSIVAFLIGLATAIQMAGAIAQPDGITGDQTASTHPTRSGTAPSAQLEDFSLLALGPNDGRAVLQFADKKLATLAIGDTVPGTRAVIAQVMVDKLVLEEVMPGVSGRQMVWMFKSGAGDKARVQRFSSFTAPTLVQQPPVEVPVTVPVTVPGAANLKGPRHKP